MISANPCFYNELQKDASLPIKVLLAALYHIFEIWGYPSAVKYQDREPLNINSIAGYPS